MPGKRSLIGLTLLGLITGALARPARAADPEVARLQAEVARLTGEVTRLQQDLREQHQLVMTLMQSDQQRYDMILQMLKAGNGGAALPMPTPAPGPTRPAPAAPSAEPAVKRTASITGKVTGGGEAYVYIDGLRGVGLRPRTVEIRQKDKQFQPAVVAVPLGSKLVFPNVDTVFHNVFSATPGQAFDTGSVKGGETSKPVTVTRPGHLEIFCNIHRKMRADVLVVPNGHFTKVGADGSFELASVPTGTHKVVLWGPGIRTTSQQVDLSNKGASVTFAAEGEATRPHLNKVGQPYGSYED